MQPWKRIDPTTVTKIGHRTIVGKTFEMPDGTVAQFETYDVEGRQYVAVIALTPDRRVIIAQQFRAGPEKIMFELPGGGVESGESLAVAMQRELLEETGYESGTYEYLGSVHKDEKLNAVHHYFVAYHCVKVIGAQVLDTDEHIDVTLLTIDEFMRYVKLGLSTDTHAVLLAYELLKPLKGDFR